MLDKATLEELLGRSLTSSEDSNLQQYINYIETTLANLLCWSPLKGASVASYEARDGFRTLWTDPFTSITEVKVDGTAVTDYKLAFNGNKNYPFYNSIIFPRPLEGQTVELTGTWGFDDLPADLGSLVAEIFKMYGRQLMGNQSGNITNKRVEDFSISYSDKSEMEALINDNASIVSKYSNCQAGDVQFGETDGRCI